MIIHTTHLDRECQKEMAKCIKRYSAEYLPKAQYYLRDFHYAEDVVSMFTHKISKNYAYYCSIETEGEQEAWVYRVFTNTLIDFVRANKFYLGMIDFVDYSGNEIARYEKAVPSYEDQYIAREQLKEMDSAARRLPPAQRAVYDLHLKGGMKIREVAEIEGKQPSAIKATTYQARKNLNKYRK